MHEETVKEIATRISRNAHDITILFKTFINDVPDGFLETHRLYKQAYDDVMSEIYEYMARTPEDERDVTEIISMYLEIDALVAEHYEYVRRIADENTIKTFEIDDTEDL